MPFERLTVAPTCSTKQWFRRHRRTPPRPSWPPSTRPSQRPPFPCTPRPHTERDQTDLYQELIRWYDHFGLKRRDGGELPDHLSVMLEFLQFLTAQEEANAGDADAASSLHKAQGDFITRQLLPLVEAVTGKLETEEPRYHALPLALRAFLEDELAALPQ